MGQLQTDCHGGPGLSARQSDTSWWVGPLVPIILHISQYVSWSRIYTEQARITDISTLWQGRTLSEQLISLCCLTTAVQPCAGCRLRRPNNFIQSRAVLCDRDSICIWELIKRLHQQNRKIVSSLAFQVILGFNVLIHLDLLILTQWKFISWKLKSDLRSKI